jgi:hypothetical protein
MADAPLDKLYSLIVDKTFGQRVAMGMYRVAREMLNEPTATPGHENRVRFAQSILYQDVENFIPYGALVISDPVIVALNTTNQKDITDVQILTAIRNMWNTLSGVGM